MTLDTYGRDYAFYSASECQTYGEEQLIGVAAEEDIVVTLTTANSYIDVNENAMECSFKSLEVVNATFVVISKKI
ncbi:hypothetical protein CRYUN_Cryun21dG0084800 [Craigia yunnanensis]